MKPPCRGCPEREPLCHASCPKYLEYRAEKDRECAERAVDCQVRDVIHEAIYKQRKPFLMKRKREGK